MGPANITLSNESAHAILREWLGTGINCRHIRPLLGGMCSTVLEIGFDAPPYLAVVKLSTAPDYHFQVEATSLDYLRRHSQMKVPKVYFLRRAGDLLEYHILVLERLPGVNLEQVTLTLQQRRDIDYQLADILTELHSHHNDTYGLIDKYESWIDEFNEQISRWFDEGRRLLTPRSLELIPPLLNAMPQALQPSGEPTLVHGDIWSANIIINKQADRWTVSGLIDPATQYADVEYELAYLQVFDTVTDAFFERYYQTYLLRTGYEIRRQFYWLNTMLLHVVCFGSRSYIERTQSIAESLERSLGN